MHIEKYELYLRVTAVKPHPMIQHLALKLRLLSLILCINIWTVVSTD